MECPLCHILLGDTNYLRSHLTEDHSDSQLQHALQKCPGVRLDSPGRAKVSFEFTSEAEELLAQLNNAKQLHSQNLLAQRQALRALSKTLDPTPAIQCSEESRGTDRVVTSRGKTNHFCDGSSPRIPYRAALSSPIVVDHDLGGVCGCRHQRREIRRLGARLTKKRAEVTELTQRLKQDMEELAINETILTDMRGSLQEMREKHSNDTAELEGRILEPLARVSRTNPDTTELLLPGISPVRLIREHMDALCLDSNPSSLGEDHELLGDLCQPSIPSAKLSKILERAERRDVCNGGIQSPSPSSDSTKSGSNLRRARREDGYKEGIQSPSLGSDSADSRASIHSHHNMDSLDQTQVGRSRKLRKIQTGTSSSCGEDKRVYGTTRRPSHSTSRSSRSSGEYSPELEWLLHQQQLLQIEFHRELMKLLEYLDQVYNR